MICIIYIIDCITFVQLCSYKINPNNDFILHDTLYVDS